MDDSTLLELIPAYALGALSEEERAAVEAFLANSETARQSLHEYQQMLDGLALLALLAPMRKAPAHMTGDFAKRLQADTQPSKSPPIELTPPIKTRTLIWRSLALVAAALIVIIGGALGYQILKHQNDLNTIAQIMNNPQARQVVMKPTDPSLGNGQVVFYNIPGSADAVLDARLPPLAADHQYQLWYIDAQSPKPADAFSVDQKTASAQLLIRVIDNLPSYNTLAITVEPYGGSPAPTTKPIAAGQLTQ